ncbi:MAG TPA: biotin/lipoate A/B protein ligase family protein [Candidatus Nanoarchaeia archaeon]|nr:biotin/lipoate A/B protein ligase family protein [Candidatus Nanoarchaeia archaeon]
MTAWRIIPLSENSAALNMAIDHAIYEAVAQNKSPPTIRFYAWKPSAVSIGTFQSMHDEIDIEKCNAQSVEYVRRRTGGGAVYHDNRGEITYSVIAPESMFPKNIIESYQVICGWIIESLRLLNITAEFKPINDICVAGKKISGNAQTRRSGVLLQHGTILYDVDVDTMFSLLKVPDEKIRDKMIAAVKDRVTRILNFTSASRKDVYDALLKGFTEGKRWMIGQLTKEEQESAQQWAETLYSSNEWNFKR